MSTFSFSRPTFLRMATSGGQQGKGGNGGSEKKLVRHKPQEYASRICLSTPGTVWFTGVGRTLSWEQGAVNIWCMQFQAGKPGWAPSSEVEDLHLLTRSRRLTNVCFSDVSFAGSSNSAICNLKINLAADGKHYATPLSGSYNASKMINCAH